MRSSVMDYAFSDRDLRVKKDVSDLKLDFLFWRRVLGKNYFFTSYRFHPSAAVPQVCGALSWQLQGQSVFVLGSVFVHGLCATNLSRESARHRRLSDRALRSTLPSGLPQPCLSQYVGRCQRNTRLAYLRRSSGAPDQKGKTALLCQEMDVELQQSVYALDSTTIDLCLNLFPWARFRSTKAAIKLHTLLDLRGPIPSFIEITNGRSHDVNALDVLVVEPGAFYVMDRGYLDFSRLYTLHQAGAYFVIRARKDLRFVRYVSQPIDPDTGLCSDHIGRLGGFSSRKDFPDKLRLVRFYDCIQDRRFCFLTNHLLLPALTICQLYKMRWQVELFFKWIKQHLRIKRFYGNSLNAVKTQVWIAVCVYVLVAILKKELQLPQSLHSILQVLSVSAFEKVPLNQLLTTTLSENYDSEDHNQLMLWDL